MAGQVTPMNGSAMERMKTAALLIAVFAVLIPVRAVSGEAYEWENSLEFEVVGPVRIPWGVWGVHTDFQRVLGDRFTIHIGACMYPVLSTNIEPVFSGLIGAGYHFNGVRKTGWFTRFLSGAGYAPGRSDFFFAFADTIGYREAYGRVSFGFGIGPYLEIHHHSSMFEEWVPEWSLIYSLSLSYLF